MTSPISTSPPLTAYSRFAFQSATSHNPALSLPPHRAAVAQQHSRPGAGHPANRGSRHLQDQSALGARRMRTVAVAAPRAQAQFRSLGARLPSGGSRAHSLRSLVLSAHPQVSYLPERVSPPGCLLARVDPSEVQSIFPLHQCEAECATFVTICGRLEPTACSERPGGPAGAQPRAKVPMWNPGAMRQLLKVMIFSLKEPRKFRRLTIYC